MEMYRCLNCGHLFEDSEEANIREAHGEAFSACPVCHGDYMEVKPCEKCGGWFFEDDLFGGLCADCIRERVTYENFLAYLMDTNLLPDFMFGKFWDSSVPKTISEKLKEDLRIFFLRQKADDLLCDKTDFLGLCQEFVMEDDGDFGREDYAKWLIRKGVK